MIRLKEFENEAFLISNSELPFFEGLVEQGTVIDKSKTATAGKANFIERVGRGYSIVIKTDSGWKAVDLGRDFEELVAWLIDHSHSGINDGGSIVVGTVWSD